MIIALHGVALVGAMVWMARTKPVEFQPPMWGVVVCALLGVVAIGAALSARQGSLRNAWAAVLIVGASFFAVAANHASLWGPTRHAHREFSSRIEQFVSPNDSLVGWEDAWAATQYYVGRTIREIDRSGELRDVIESNGATWVLVNADDPIKLPKNAQGRLMMAVACEGRDDALQLWRVAIADEGG
jgi:hypothetical protein